MPDNYTNIVKYIAKNVDQDNFVAGMYDSGCDVNFGDFLISGMTQSGTQMIGYVVQIRKKWGAFGSDMFLIRHPDGDLIRHENQSFWKLTEDQIQKVRPYFDITVPESELKANPDIQYTLESDQAMSGFIIHKDSAPNRTDSCSFVINVN